MTQEQLTELGITEEEWNEFGPYEKLFLDVTQQLSKEDDLRWIDLEAGQLEIPEENYPVDFPCALVDFPQSGFQDITRGNQEGQLMVQVRLGLDLYEDFHMADGISAPDRGVAVKRLQIITRIHKLLQRFGTDYSTPMSRTDIQTERRDDGIKIFTMIYQCKAIDSSAADVVTYKTGVGLGVNKG